MFHTYPRHGVEEPVINTLLNIRILNNIMPGDSFMAYRGFDIAESLAVLHANPIVPAYMKGRSQLSKDDVLTTRKIVNVRIHVERVTGVVRQKY